ncbi:MAG: SpoVR family protein [Phycisphaerales bacterium]|nr:MAG: SpoVR family protein [Phycisphaerales bacterium]
MVTKSFTLHGRRLPREIQEEAERIAEIARSEGLDFFPTIFEMLSTEQISQVAAYGGFPKRYPHWRFGMEYERLRKQHKYGLGRIYEMVINTDPCYAYLLDDNAMVDHKTVIAHVYAHCDFFKNNVWFSKTNRRMMDEMANHATRIHRYIDRYGLEEVEKFIDTALALENLIDPHSAFMRREPVRMRKENKKKKEERKEAPAKFPAKSYMDRYINPPDKLAEETEAREQKKSREKAAFPGKPTRDVLLFLLQHAPLEDWQADVLATIREEAYYFAPQAQTKIMNEGWASYWHSALMTQYILRDHELIDYCEHHSGTLATSPGRLNPYKLGIELFRDIEHRWNTGRYGPEYDSCDDMTTRREWGNDKTPQGRIVGKGSPGREKIFQVRALYNDVTFLDEFLTPEFVEDQDLYHYRMDPTTGRMVVVNRDFNKIKQQMLFMLTNHAQPYIYVIDGNYHNRGELCLGHRHVGADLDIKYAIATLKELHKIWKRPVHVMARIDDAPFMFSFDGEQSSQQQIDESIPEPAHSV